MILVDLAKPDELWSTLETTLTAIKDKSSKVFTALKLRDKAAAEALKHRLRSRYTVAEDADKCDPLTVDCAIIGAYYDAFQVRFMQSRALNISFLATIMHEPI